MTRPRALSRIDEKKTIPTPEEGTADAGLTRLAVRPSRASARLI
jgi:hypothetical protein